MKDILRHFFVPHKENGYHPHVLHPKRAVFYSMVFCAIKGVLVLCALLLPTTAFLSDDFFKGEEEILYTLTNELRASQGVATLGVDELLATSAMLKAEDMATKGYFSHVGPDGRGLASFLSEAEYDYGVAGENLGMGFYDALSLFRAWVNSETHYANLIDGSFDEVGFAIRSGVFEGKQVTYVVQHFGTTADALPAKIAAERIHSVVVAPQENGVSSSYPFVWNATDTIVKDTSFISQESVEGGLLLRAHVSFLSPIHSAYVKAHSTIIPLSFDEDLQMYTGAYMVDLPPEGTFSGVVPATLHVVDASQNVRVYPLLWKEVSPGVISSVQQYFLAKRDGSPLAPLFLVSQWIYGLCTLFFIIILGVKVFVHIRHQHYHVIGQTLGLLFLLGTFFFI
ncbi:MAG: CAP domain-containing protein [Candidatus Magasanikbacteria bacterium]|nr:CAP domain-containing protein [Candidatus Magasanikbacteria bacterium]MBT4220828.1 CAP domain-containing protein [Candidatus Magasanikbacteria bacterium]MBT4350173.1 CAP domain-containing protein [Candidatus Magasanikbacteria bacterium]MBT4541384.1 CAP domain-containing protein [Candidatus Magasanikbacteria bacterium]MBT6253176.1 CAP domain-containing protein [Candidatus Magasanikbacteria bacterium]